MRSIAMVVILSLKQLACDSRNNLIGFTIMAISSWMAVMFVEDVLRLLDLLDLSRMLSNRLDELLSVEVFLPLLGFVFPVALLFVLDMFDTIL